VLLSYDTLFYLGRTMRNSIGQLVK